MCAAEEDLRRKTRSGVHYWRKEKIIKNNERREIRGVFLYISWYGTLAGAQQHLESR